MLNWSCGEAAYGQSIVKGCGLSLASVGRRREGSANRINARQTSAASQALREVQS